MKKMLSTLAIVMATMCVPVTFTSCGDDDDDTSFITSASFDVNKLYGTWNCTGYSAGGTYYYHMSQLDGTTIYFGKNGKLTTKGYMGDYSNVDYTINGDYVTITPPKGSSGYIRFKVVSLDEKEAYLKLEVNQTSGYFRFEK